MPSVLTHCWYGDVAASTTGCSQLQQIIRKNHSSYMMGCQGPDPFYFYHRWPWVSHKRLKLAKRFADLLHKELINSSISMFIEHVKEKNDDMLTAYLCGYLSHWAMDSICHPYIFYRTDSVKDIGDNLHQRFEEQLDRGVLMVNNVATEDYQSRKLCAYPAALPRAVYEMMAPVFSQLAQLELLYEDINESFKDFLKFQKLFYDPSGRKKKYIAAAEKFTNTNGLATDMIMPVEYDDKLDAMNFRQQLWKHPSDDTICSNESFTDLAARGVERALKVFELLEECLYRDGSVQAVVDFIDDRDFTTGMKPGREMKYFELDGK